MGEGKSAPEVTSSQEKMRQLVARDSAGPYRPPSLGGPSSGAPTRCPRCSFPIPQQGGDPSGAASTSGWAMAPFLRDSLATLGAASAGSVAAVYAFNGVMPRISRRFPHSVALQYAVGVPPVALLASVGAGLGAGILPALVQVCMSSYYYASSSSNAGILGAYQSLTTKGEGGREKPPASSRTSETS